MRMNQAIEKGYDAFQKQKDQLVNEQTLDQFKKTTMAPLNAIISQQGTQSKTRDILSVLLQKFPAEPFVEEELPENPILRRRKIEELRLDEMLKACDKEMLRTNMIRLLAVRGPLIILLIVEGILASIISGPWTFWGLCLLTMAGEGISYYVNYRLRLMERKKEAIKLQYILRDHPDIGAIPGNHPELAQLKEVQGKYGLEGIAPTWARALTDSQTVSQELETALYQEVKTRRQIALSDPAEGGVIKEKFIERIQQCAKAGFQQAESQLQYQLGVLESEKSALKSYMREEKINPTSKAGRKLVAKIKRCEAKIEHLTTPHEAEAVEKTKEEEEEKKLAKKFLVEAKKRSRASEGMSNDRAELFRARQKKKLFLEKLKEFERLENVVGAQLATGTAAPDELEFIMEAWRGRKNPPIAGLQLVSLIQEIRLGLNSLRMLGRDLKFKSMRGYMEQLRSFPKEELFKCAQTLRMLELLKDPKQFKSKEYVRACIAQCGVIEKAITLDFQKHQERYKTYDSRVKKLEAQLQEAKRKRTKGKKESGVAALPQENCKAKLEKSLFEHNEKCRHLGCKAEEIERAQFWQDHQDELRRLYGKLDVREQESVWWILPPAFRDELSGDSLLTFCRYALCDKEDEKGKYLSTDYEKAQKHWEKLGESKEGKAFLSQAIKLPLYSEIDKLHSGDPKQIEEWWNVNLIEFKSAFSRIDPKRQKMIYDNLPHDFQVKLESVYVFLTGIDVERALKMLVDAVSRTKKPKEVFEKHWTNQRAAIVKRFQQLPPYHQARIFTNHEKMVYECLTPKAKPLLSGPIFKNKLLT